MKLNDYKCKGNFLVDVRNNMANHNVINLNDISMIIARIIVQSFDYKDIISNNKISRYLIDYRNSFIFLYGRFGTIRLWIDTESYDKSIIEFAKNYLDLLDKRSMYNSSVFINRNLIDSITKDEIIDKFGNRITLQE